MSRNTIKRRMARDPTFPQPLDDGYRLLWYVDELLEWKERWLASLPRRQYSAESYRENAAHLAADAEDREAEEATAAKRRKASHRETLEAPAEKMPSGEAGNEGAEAA